jgi:hypothetical protein
MIRQGRTYDEIQAVTGLSRDTITRCKKGDYYIPEAMVNAFKKAESEKFTMLAHRIIDSVNMMSMEELKKIPLNQRMIAAGIAVDKRNLIDGLPTQRVQFLDGDQDIKALDDEIQRLEKLLDDKTVDVTDDETPIAFDDGDPGPGSDPNSQT